MTATPSDSISLVAQKLIDGGYQWMVVGSVSGFLHGRNRATVDMDIVLDCSSVDAGRLSSQFAPEFMLDAHIVRDSVKAGFMFNALPITGGLKIDIIPLGNDAFDRSAFARRVIVEWHGTPIPTQTPADLVIAKLRWAKESLSDRQLGDVHAIMAMGLVDEHHEYFQNWITRLGLSAALDASRFSRYDA